MDNSLRVRASTSAYLSRTESNKENSGKWYFETKIKSGKSVDFTMEKLPLEADENGIIQFTFPRIPPENTRMYIHSTKDIDGVLFNCVEVYDGDGKLIKQHLDEI